MNVVRSAAPVVRTGMTSQCVGTSRTVGKVVCTTPVEGDGRKPFCVCRIDACRGSTRKVSWMEVLPGAHGSSDGSVVYRVTANTDTVDELRVICALDGNIFGSDERFDLTPLQHKFACAAIYSRAAAARQAEKMGIVPAASQKRSSSGDTSGSDGPPEKLARVTDLYSALGRNATAIEVTGLRGQQMALWGMGVTPQNFTTAERKLWSKEEKAMFGTQAQLHGFGHASSFMRDYFKNNEGKPLPPPKPPKSAFFVFKSEQVRRTLPLAVARLIYGW